jgi:hypothetical protein
MALQGGQATEYLREDVNEGNSNEDTNREGVPGVDEDPEQQGGHSSDTENDRRDASGPPEHAAASDPPSTGIGNHPLAGQDFT